MKSDPKNEQWKCAGWDDHANLRREIAKGMSFAERLRWLEGASRSGRLLRDARVVEPPAFARRAAK
jgi:hypothetical protein